MELKNVGWLFRPIPLTVKPAGHRLDMRGGGANHRELPFGQVEAGGPASAGGAVAGSGIDIGGLRIGNRR